MENHYDPPLPEETPPPLPPGEPPVAPPPSTQSSNEKTVWLDLSTGVGGNNERLDTEPAAKRARLENPLVYSLKTAGTGSEVDSLEEGELDCDSEEDNFNSRCKSFGQRLSIPTDRLPCDTQISGSDNDTATEDKDKADTRSLLKVVDLGNGKMSDNSKVDSQSELNMDSDSETELSGTMTSEVTIGPFGQSSHEFEIIDDVGSDQEDRGPCDLDDSDEEFSMDEDEIDAMLESGMQDYKGRRKLQMLYQQNKDGKGDDYLAPLEKEKVVMKERGKDPFDILPEAWVVVTHNSGMPVYLHKQTRVCTLSKPYFLGPGSARKHDIPLSAIPCLQYKRALLKEENPTETGDAEDSNNPVQESIVNGDIASTSITLKNGTCQSNTDQEASPSEQTSQGSTSNDAETSSVTETGTDNLGSSDVPSVKIKSAEQHKQSCLDPMEFRGYCEKLFEFKAITVKRFKTWKDRRKHNLMLKKGARPQLPSDTKLIVCPIVTDKHTGDKPNRKREFLLNPVGKSDVCVLHEYVQHAMKVQPRYTFKELENAQTPYSATVIINGVEYGTGYASSKKAAKSVAAKETLEILIPEMIRIKEEKKDHGLQDLSFFDEIKIEDRRVTELCSKAGQPSPFAILHECLKRNYGMGDTQVQMEMRILKHQKSEFVMRVGKHEAKVICKNKREGKQQAAQAILQMLHPHIQSWGSLLRLYGRGQKAMKEKRMEEQSVTELQMRSKSLEPNMAVLNKLCLEMSKLQAKREAFKSNVKGKLQLEGSSLSFTQTGIVDL